MTEPLVSTSMFEEQRANQWRTGLFLGIGVAWVALLGFFTVLLQFTLWGVVLRTFDEDPSSHFSPDDALYWSRWGAVALAAAWATLALVTYQFSAEGVPRALGAEPPTGSVKARLENALRKVLARAGRATEVPALFAWDVKGATAFAAGHDLRHGSIVVTRGLLETLDDDELECVMAHEVAHLENRDSAFSIQAVALVTMVIAVGCFGALMAGVVVAAMVAAIALVGAIMSAGDGEGAWVVALLGLAAIIAILVVGFQVLLCCLVIFGGLTLVVGVSMRCAASAVSHSREHLADAHAAQWAARPEKLVTALLKISARSEPLPLRGLLLQPLLIGPTPSPIRKDGYRRLVDLMFETHPPVDSRVAALRAMLGSQAHLRLGGLHAPPDSARTLQWVLPLIVSASLAAGAVFVMPKDAADAARWVDPAGVAAGASHAGGPPPASPPPTSRPPRAGASRTSSAWINQPEVWLRRGPSTSSAGICLLGGGTPVRVLEVVHVRGPEPTWFRVSTADGRGLQGWVAGRLVSFQR